jgi:hypothetical protein
MIFLNDLRSKSLLKKKDLLDLILDRFFWR